LSVWNGGESRLVHYRSQGQSRKKEKTVITYKLLQTEGILLLTPDSPLEATDFENLAQEIDPYIEQNGKLHGLMIDAASFPGWKDFAGLVAHLRFVKNHHQKIQRVAVVSDSSFLSFAPKIASHFVQADVKHFSCSQREDALLWLKGESQ
jgi:hypothetical protein